MHRCRRVGTVGMCLEPTTAIDENRDGTRDSHCSSRESDELPRAGRVGVVHRAARKPYRQIEGRVVRRIRGWGDNPMLSGLAVASDGVVWFAMLHSGSLG